MAQVTYSKVGAGTLESETVRVFWGLLGFRVWGLGFRVWGSGSLCLSLSLSLSLSVSLELARSLCRTPNFNLVAEWIRFTLFGILLPTIKLKVYTFWGL